MDTPSRYLAIGWNTCNLLLITDARKDMGLDFADCKAMCALTPS